MVEPTETSFMQGCSRKQKWAGVVSVGIGLVVLAGCGHTEWRYVAVRDVNIALPSAIGAEPTVNRAGTPGEPLRITSGGPRCVLIAVQAHADPDREARGWGRAFVVVLDGPPAKGKINVTPDNGRLVCDSPRRPARQPYVGLEGYIEIRSVKGGEVEAYCVLRSEIVDAYDDAFVLRGLYEFHTAAGSEALLRRSGIEVAGPLK
jgi:hypothetical protein